MRSVLRFVSLLLLSCASIECLADGLTDCVGCKDHPMLARYPGSTLLGAEQKRFEEAALPLGPVTQTDASADVAPKTLNVTGKRTSLFYLAPSDRSGLEVFTNYKEALQKAGLGVVWTCTDSECGDDFASQTLALLHLKLENTPESSLAFVNAERPRYLLGKLARPQGDVEIMVLVEDKTDVQRPAVLVVIVESKPMDSGLVSVAAAALDHELITLGKAVIYGITFDVDKAEIKPESIPQLEQIAKLMNDRSALKLLVTGHTDNEGTSDHNQKLSQRRADAIVARLVGTYSIAASRLDARGMGAGTPIASNDTDEGRARNRRVELIKQ